MEDPQDDRPSAFAAKDKARSLGTFWLAICVVNVASTYYLWDGPRMASTPFENPRAAAALLAAVLYLVNLFLPLIPIMVFWFFLIVWRNRRNEDRPNSFPRVPYVVCYGLLILLERYATGRSLL